LLFSVDLCVLCGKKTQKNNIKLTNLKKSRAKKIDFDQLYWS
jgi:hypothetical protein